MLIKTNRFVKWLFPNYVWDIPNKENKIFLTFDDGPIPQVTDWVLDVLKTENIQAVFFCIGANIEKHPEIFNRILKENHIIGNHTFNHLNGWKTKSETYTENVIACQKQEVKSQKSGTYLQLKRLFRPPYGKIKSKQANILRKIGYKIVMWDVISYDFDQHTSPEKCLENVIKNTTSGSIIVFHDSLKSEKNLKYTLPKAIKILKEKGFVFDTISTL